MSPSLAHALFWACVLACATAQGALLWTAVRRQERVGGTYDGDRRHASRRERVRWSPDRRTSPAGPPHDPRSRELIWSLLPAIALALLLAATWAALP